MTNDLERAMAARQRDESQVFANPTGKNQYGGNMMAQGIHRQRQNEAAKARGQRRSGNRAGAMKTIRDAQWHYAKP